MAAFSSRAVLAAVVGVLADVFVGQVGAEHGSAGRSTAKVDVQYHATLVRWKIHGRMEDAVLGRSALIELGLLDVLDQLLFDGGIDAKATVFEDGLAPEGDADASKADVGRVDADVLADSHDDAAHVGVVAGEGALHQRRIDDRLAQRACKPFRGGTTHSGAHDMANAFAV